jgi:hypothetical protein
VTTTTDTVEFARRLRDRFEQQAAELARLRAENADLKLALVVAQARIRGMSPKREWRRPLSQRIPTFDEEFNASPLEAEPIWRRGD